MLAEIHVMQVLYKKIPLHDKIMLCKLLYEEDVHEIKLWKFHCNNQKHHVMGNHVMKNHDRQGLAVIE